MMGDLCLINVFKVGRAPETGNRTARRSVPTYQSTLNNHQWI